MPLPSMCSFHEDRIQNMESEMVKLTSNQAVLEIKIQDVLEHVKESKEHIVCKLDSIADKMDRFGNKISALDTKVKDLEKTKKTVSGILFKLSVPVGFILFGLASGVQWNKLVEVAVKLFTGE